MKKFLIFLGITLMINLIYAQDVVSVAKTAIRGYRVSNFHFQGHDFHVKPVTVVRDRNGLPVVASGNISHILCCRPDDLVYYRITFNRDGTYKITVNYNHRGLTWLIEPVVGDYFAGISNRIGELISGDWGPACAQIIDAIAGVLAAEYR